MTIALFSDIHANLPALKAFFESVDAKKPDMIYCLGDLIGYNIWPNEVIQEIRKRGIATIAGNHDVKFKAGKSYSINDTGKNYAYAIVDAEGIQYLNTLPAHLRLEFQLNNDHLNLLLVHGSPESINEYLLEDMPEEALLAKLNNADADILCFGHTHKPYHRVIRGKHAINTGSVGKPKDGDPRGCYVLLHINEDSGIDVEFVRFEYDIGAAAKGVEDSPLPNEFADMLRGAY